MPTTKNVHDIIESIYWITEGKEFRSEDDTLIFRDSRNEIDHINLLTINRVNGLIGTADNKTARWSFKDENFYMLISYFPKRTSAIIFTVFIERKAIFGCYAVATGPQDNFIKIDYIYSITKEIKMPQIKNIDILQLETMSPEVRGITQNHIRIEENR
jgi:hypothetical protein